MSTFDDKLPPNIDLGWITRKIRDLERQVQNLQGARGLQSSSIGAGGLRITSGGDVTIDDGGRIRVLNANGSVALDMGAQGAGQIRAFDDNGDAVFYVGRLVTGSTPIGAGMLLKDPAGSNRFEFYQLGSTGRMLLAMKSSDGSTVFATDEVSGVGLARPYLTTPMYPANTGTYQTTTDTSFSSLWTGELWMTHPKVWLQLPIFASGGAGEARLLIGGIQVGSTISIPSGTTAFFTIGPANLPNYDHYGTTQVIIQARRTGGAGTIGVGMYGFMSVQS